MCRIDWIYFVMILFKLSALDRLMLIELPLIDTAFQIDSALISVHTKQRCVRVYSSSSWTSNLHPFSPGLHSIWTIGNRASVLSRNVHAFRSDVATFVFEQSSWKCVASAGRSNWFNPSGALVNDSIAMCFLHADWIPLLEICATILHSFAFYV